jgi:hypothetical protein
MGDPALWEQIQHVRHIFLPTPLPRKSLFPGSLLLAVMEAVRPRLATLRLCASSRAPRPLYQCLHTSAPRCAQTLPQPAVPGPPPQAPTSDALERVARKRRQADLLKQAQEGRASKSRPKTVLQKRFWQDVTVQDTEGNSPSPFELASTNNA